MVMRVSQGVEGEEGEGKREAEPQAPMLHPPSPKDNPPADAVHSSTEEEEHEEPSLEARERR